MRSHGYIKVRAHVSADKKFEDTLNIKWAGITNRTGKDQAILLILRNAKDTGWVGNSGWVPIANNASADLSIAWVVGLTGGLVVGANKMKLFIYASATTVADIVAVAEHEIGLTLVT